MFSYTYDSRNQMIEELRHLNRQLMSGWESVAVSVPAKIAGTFSASDFIKKHTPEQQREYLQNRMNGDTKVFILVDEIELHLTCMFPQVTG